MTEVGDIASSDKFSTEQRCGDGKGFNKKRIKYYVHSALSRP